MKKLVYRNMLGKNPRKHEVSMEEITDRLNAKVIKKRSCKYFIKDSFSSENDEDLKYWVKTKRMLGCRKDCHIMRHANTETGENQIICKVLGEFFVILEKTAYKIMYVNEIKIKVEYAENNFRRVI